jgi:hypothetical protein
MGLIVLAILGALAAVIAVLSRWGAVFIIFTIMAFMASISYGMAGEDKTLNTWLAPVEAQRSLIFLFMGGLLLLSFLVHGLSREGVFSHGFALVIVGLYNALMRAVHAEIMDAALTLVFVMVTQLGLILALSRMVRDEMDWYKCFRCVGIASLLWIGAALVQLAINPDAMLRHGPYFARFQGMTFNPQAAALTLGITSVVTIFLALNDPKHRYRVFWTAAAGLNLVFLLWTGSRTGMGIFTLGAASVLVSRFSRVILLVPIVAGIVMVTLTLLGDAASDISSTADRLTSTEDSRTHAWGAMWQVFVDNPVIGGGPGKEERGGRSENSYLYGLAAFGAGMGLLLLMLFIVSVAQCLRLFVRRGRAPKRWHPIIDVVIGYQAVYFIAAMVEGYIMARVNIHILMFYMTAAIAAALIKRIDEGQADWYVEEAYDAEHDTEEGAAYSEQYGEHIDAYEYEYGDGAVVR